MSDATTTGPETEVTEAIYVRFLPLNSILPVDATLSRKTAEELFEQLKRQLHPELVVDDGQPTA